MKKKVITWSVVVVFLVMLFVSFVISQSQTTYADEIQEAFVCLDNEVESVSSLTLEQAVFSALADVDNSKINSTIDSKEISANCWAGSGGTCNVKETAQVALAKKHMGEDISGIISWLETQTGAIQDLDWYLQISINNNAAGECIVRYGGTDGTGGTDYDVDVGADLKLSGNTGSCLDLANSDYWLRIDDSCVDEKFDINCGGEISGFKTNLLYQGSGGGTTFVSSDTNPGDPNGWTSEEIGARCFRQGGNCDYEASLWATFALSIEAENTENFAPYLRALSNDNREFFPSAFLFHILGDTSLSDEEYQEILDEQDTGGLWGVAGSANDEYFNSALAMLFLGSDRGGADAAELSNSAVPRLFNVQAPSGCWGTITDTAFLLYSSQWDRIASTDPASGECIEQGGNTNINIPQCCAGLDLNVQNLLADGTCSAPGVYGTCTNWGDGVCETGENICTSVEDCAAEVTETSCLNGQWFIAGTDAPINTTEIAGYCSLETDGCCESGFECIGTGSVSICEESATGGGPGPLNPTNRCSGGDWFDENGVERDTRDSAGYCNLDVDEEDYPYGCCKAGYRCDGEDNESICVFAGSSDSTPGSGGQTDCELANFYCAPDGYECLVAGGEPLTDLNCNVYPEACCSVDVPERTCFDEGGTICANNEDCTGSTHYASDGPCCTDTCVPRSTNTGGGTGGDTPGNEPSEPSDEDGGSSLWIWIILLIILIGLVVLGIIYKDKIRVWWFKMSGKAKTSKVRPRPSGAPVMRRAPPRFGPPRAPHRVASMATPKTEKKLGAKEKDMQDTLKKLKEMSK